MAPRFFATYAQGWEYAGRFRYRDPADIREHVWGLGI